MGSSTLVITGALVLTAMLACKRSAPSSESTPSPQFEPVASPTEGTSAAASFAGSWDTAWGKVTLTQTGGAVAGQYVGQFTGNVSGQVEGNVATLTWTQTNGENGRAKFTLSADGQRFTGTWGSGASATNGGPWNGKRR